MIGYFRGIPSTDAVLVSNLIQQCIIRRTRQRSQSRLPMNSQICCVNIASASCPWALSFAFLLSFIITFVALGLLFIGHLHLILQMCLTDRTVMFVDPLVALDPLCWNPLLEHQNPFPGVLDHPPSGGSIPPNTSQQPSAQECACLWLQMIGKGELDFSAIDTSSNCASATSLQHVRVFGRRPSQCFRLCSLIYGRWGGGGNYETTDHSFWEKQGERLGSGGSNPVEKNCGENAGKLQEIAGKLCYRKQPS